MADLAVVLKGLVATTLELIDQRKFRYAGMSEPEQTRFRRQAWQLLADARRISGQFQTMLSIARRAGNAPDTARLGKLRANAGRVMSAAEKLYNSVKRVGFAMEGENEGAGRRGRARSVGAARARGAPAGSTSRRPPVGARTNRRRLIARGVASAVAGVLTGFARRRQALAEFESDPMDMAGMAARLRMLAQQIAIKFSDKDPSTFKTMSDVAVGMVDSTIASLDPKGEIVKASERKLAAKAIVESVKAAAPMIMDQLRNMLFEAESEAGLEAGARTSTGAGAGARGLAARSSRIAARRQVRAATTPAFAAAFDRVIPPAALARAAARLPGADPALLRSRFVRFAAGRFAIELVRALAAAPGAMPAPSILTALIATAIAEAARRHPIVPPAAVPAMSTLVQRPLSAILLGLGRRLAIPGPGPRAAPALPPSSAASPRTMTATSRTHRPAPRPTQHMMPRPPQRHISPRGAPRREAEA